MPEFGVHESNSAVAPIRTDPVPTCTHGLDSLLLECAWWEAAPAWSICSKHLLHVFGGEGRLVLERGSPQHLIGYEPKPLQAARAARCQALTGSGLGREDALNE